MSAETRLNKPELWKSFLEFGGVGDGVTDNTAAFTLAQTWLNANAGTVFFPHGRYLTSTGMVLYGPQQPGVNAYGQITLQGENGSEIIYSGAGTFCAYGSQSGGTRDSRLLLFIHVRDLVITKSGSAGSSIAFDLINAGAYHVWENCWIENFSIGVRSFDNNGCIMRNCTVEFCTSRGVALGWQSNLWLFDTVYFNGITGSIGAETGYYDSRFDSIYGGAGLCADVTFLNCGFHFSKIGLVIGGNIARNVNVLYCYFESHTQSNIEVGHNSTDFSGSQLEVADLYMGEIQGCYFEFNVASAPIKVYRAITHLRVEKLTIVNLGAAQPVVKTMAAGPDGSGIEMLDLRSPCYHTSAGVATSQISYTTPNGRRETYHKSVTVTNQTDGDPVINISRATDTDYAILRFTSGSLTGYRWDLSTYGDNDLSLVRVGDGVKRFFFEYATYDFVAAYGNIRVGTAGKGLQVKEGSNAKQGTATLVGGTVTVANTSVTANSRIFLTIQSLGTVAAPKAIGVTARVVGTSFTITSADGTDTSVVAYEIFEPA